MNVAMTHRRKLLIVGDSATLAGHPFYRRMIEYFSVKPSGPIGPCGKMRISRRSAS